MIAGFFALVVSLPALIKHPWIIVVAAIGWLGFQIFNGFRESSIRASFNTGLNSSDAGRAEWVKATQKEKLEYILQRNKHTKSIFPDDVLPDPDKVIAEIDKYFAEPSPPLDSIAFAMGSASAKIEDQELHPRES